MTLENPPFEYESYKLEQKEDFLGFSVPRQLLILSLFSNLARIPHSLSTELLYIWLSISTMKPKATKSLIMSGTSFELQISMMFVTSQNKAESNFMKAIIKF